MLRFHKIRYIKILPYYNYSVNYIYSEFPFKNSFQTLLGECVVIKFLPSFEKVVAPVLSKSEAISKSNKIDFQWSVRVASPLEQYVSDMFMQ